MKRPYRTGKTDENAVLVGISTLPSADPNPKFLTADEQGKLIWFEFDDKE